MPICSSTSYWHHIWATGAWGAFSLSFHEVLLGETIPLCSYFVYLQYYYIVLNWRAFEKWDERKWKLVLTLNHISGAEIRSHLLGRERACVTQQSSVPLAPPKPRIPAPWLWHQGFPGCVQDKSAIPSLLSGKDSLLLIRSRSRC